MSLNRIVMALGVAVSLTAAAAAQQPRESTLPYYYPPQTFERVCEGGCSGPTGWYKEAMDQAMAAWQRLRQAGAASTKTAPGCCEAGCGVGAVAKPATGIKVVCCVKCAETKPDTKACCCAKACACCESCKDSKKKTTAVAPMCLPCPMFEAVAPAGVCQPGCCVPGMPGINGIQFNANGMPVEIRQIIIAVPVANKVNSARLVTPDLEAHCERMTQRGDSVILEGNVLMVCKKHAQPMRVEAQRIVVNMKDGSFSVESTPVTTPTGFGTMRWSGSTVTPTTVEWSAPISVPAMPRGTGTTSPTPSTRPIEMIPIPGR